MAISLKITLLVVMAALFVATSSAQLLAEISAPLPPGLTENIPADLPERIPKWETCDYPTQAGASCVDCKTILICTAVGGFRKECANPNRPHCTSGYCSRTPSAECADTTTTEAAILDTTAGEEI